MVSSKQPKLGLTQNSKAILRTYSRNGTVMPCPHHTSPGHKSEDICSHLTYTGLATCGGRVWTASQTLKVKVLRYFDNSPVKSLKSLDDSVDGIVHR